MLAVLLAFVLGQIVGPLHIEEEEDGPQISFASTRDQVFYCDFSSPVCSDGRRITTTRSTPVPCETSPGVWEIIPADEGCYSVRGLESWTQNTSYLSWGAELDRKPWEPNQGGAVEVLPDGYRIHPAAGRGNSGLQQAGLVAVPAGGESRTLACIVRTHQPAYLRYWLTGSHSVSFPAVDTGGRWEVVVGTREVPEGASPIIRVGNGPADEAPQPFDVKACWLTRTDTPGRPCWGGEAPVTCAADRHTISTEGWPTESGSISVAFKFEEFSEAFSIILDARTAPSSGFNIHYDRSNGRLVHRQGSRLLQGPTVETGRPYFVELRRKGPKVEMLLNGVLVASDDDWPPWSYSPIAVLGKHFDPSNVLYVKGSISSLRVRSAE